MNGYYNDYNRVVFETPEERQQKIKKQRGLFSRVLLALVVYILTSRIAATLTYAILSRALSPESYQAMENSAVWPLVISCGAQYLIAFPVFILMLTGTKTAANKEPAKLSGAELLTLFAIGEALMYAGNLVGNFLNGVIGTMIGQQPENTVASIVNQTPIWLIFVLMVVLAPIVEELMFRKLMIDRLSVYGDKVAILFSAVSFGLMHGNLYQFFYATLLGALFGYVYTKTRKIEYTVIMHMIVNFMGSIVALPVQKALADLYEILDVAARGEPINILALIVSGTVMFVYTNMQYGLIIGGVIALWNYIKKKSITISPDKEIYLPDGEIIKHGIVNVGGILFLIISFFTIFLNLFTV